MFFPEGQSEKQPSHMDDKSAILSGKLVIQTSSFFRKENLSPEEQKQTPLLSPKRVDYLRKGRTFFFASLWKKLCLRCFLRASMTVEAAAALPIFFFCMIALLSVGRTYQSAMKLSSALTQAAEEMAIGAYASEYVDMDPLPGTVLSTAWATGRVLGLAGETPGIKNKNLLLSSVMQEQDMIRLRLTWQMRLFAPVPAPGRVFCQTGCVRGWTGRKGSGGTEETETAEGDAQTVYVTETGTVYHRDPNCTHIHLSISSVGKDEAQAMRNRYGARYHACEKCGRYAGSTVYITTDGNRYHSSLDCPGLKRTVHEVTMDEAGHLRPCSKCGGGS